MTETKTISLVEDDPALLMQLYMLQALLSICMLRIGRKSGDKRRTDYERNKKLNFR